MPILLILLDTSGTYNNSHQNDGYMVLNLLYIASAVAMKMKEAIG